ncbi:MAG: MafB family polymorphic toxin, partial [Neisseriaceae bacterium]|nr:MafB family polymorphic toxin [Neisseriaceae bacterium]
MNNEMKNKIFRLSLKMTNKLSGCLKKDTVIASLANTRRTQSPCYEKRTYPKNDNAKSLSGCLKHIVLTGVLGLSVHFTYADDITNTNNYLPNGKYRLFGSGRGEVQNIDNQIRLHSQLNQQAGNLQIETKNYQGNLSYEQHFHNHGHRVHAPFSNTAQKNFSAKKGSVVQGGATLTDLSVTGYEIHPSDAYDGEQGGGYPAPTGARDEYLYEVNGKEVSVKVVTLDKLPNKINDNQLLREAGI